MVGRAQLRAGTRWPSAQISHARGGEVGARSSARPEPWAAPRRCRGVVVHELGRDVRARWPLWARPGGAGPRSDPDHPGRGDAPAGRAVGAGGGPEVGQPGTGGSRARRGRADTCPPACAGGRRRGHAMPAAHPSAWRRHRCHRNALAHWSSAERTASVRRRCTRGCPFHRRARALSPPPVVRECRSCPAGVV